MTSSAASFSRIDYEHKMIELSDPNAFKYSGKGTEIPMAFHGNTPQVKVSILSPRPCSH